MQQSQHLQVASKHTLRGHALNAWQSRGAATTTSMRELRVWVQVARQLALIPVTARLVEYEYDYDDHEDDVLQKML